MSTHATAVFEVKTGDQKPYQEIEGGSRPITLDYSID
jgi:hypothetical protein